jgi:UDP-N-acetylmuramoyl-tripeptide--D-alanyl-D-alanine ligase
MGANHPHEILPLTQMAKPDVAIITMIAPVHTEGFGSLDVIAQTKAEIFMGLGENGVAVINADDAYYDFFQQQLIGKKVLRFSMTGNPAEISASDITFNEGCPAFLLQTPKGNIAIQLPILGKHNVVNALAAASAAIALDISLPQIAEGLLKMQSAKHRLHVCQGFHQARIIDDAYNANPVAVKAAIDILASYPGEKVWVFSDMRELGQLAKDAHEEVGLFAKEKGIQRIFAVGEFSAMTVAAFGEGAQHFPDKPSLIAALKPLMHKDMTILIKGSRGGRLEEVVDALTFKE